MKDEKCQTNEPSQYEAPRKQMRPDRRASRRLSQFWACNCLSVFSNCGIINKAYSFVYVCTSNAIPSSAVPQIPLNSAFSQFSHFFPLLIPLSLCLLVLLFLRSSAHLGACRGCLSMNNAGEPQKLYLLSFPTISLSFSLSVHTFLLSLSLSSLFK